MVEYSISIKYANNYLIYISNVIHVDCFFRYCCKMRFADEFWVCIHCIYQDGAISYSRKFWSVHLRIHGFDLSIFLSDTILTFRLPLVVLHDYVISFLLINYIGGRRCTLFWIIIILSFRVSYHCVVIISPPIHG